MLISTVLIPSEGRGLFDLVLGLPMHPLVVHFAVVLLPLAAAALIAIIVVPALRRTFGWLVFAGLLVGVPLSMLAKESGESLAARVGWPSDHARWGDLLPWAALALLFLGTLWLWMQRKTPRREPTSLLTRVIAVFAAAVALATIVLTVVVGHTGAIAVWQGRIQSTVAGNSQASTPSTNSNATTLTMDEVAKHASASDCWSVVNGTVYDLTSWINQHPGGSSPIESMCGVDATSAFTAQHGGQQTPTKVLDGFALGPLNG